MDSSQIIPSPMGRPPLGVRATTIRITEGIDHRIKRVLEPREKLAAFARKAILAELQRREAEKKPKRSK
jgi:hypothetical protein